MAIPNILLAYLHRPMSVGLFYRYGFRQTGCRVRTMGPVIDTVYDHEFPADDWERPDFPVTNNEPMEVGAAIELAKQSGFTPDAVVMCDQFDPYYLIGASPIPWAWLAVENFNAEQLERYEQRSGAVETHMISHFKNNATHPPEGSEFLPFAFDSYIQPLLGRERDKVVVQIGTHYDPRPAVWNGLRAALDQAPPIATEVYAAGPAQESASTLFGKVFSYQGAADVYNRGRITISASNCDFLPMRIFEAFAMGCVLVSDDQPILRKWIGAPSEQPNIGLWFAHDGTPDGIVRTVMEVAALPTGVLEHVASNAFAFAASRHTYMHRARRVLEKLGLQGACRLVTD